MANDLDRRDFLAGLGVALGGAALGDLPVVGAPAPQDTPHGRMPPTPLVGLPNIVSPAGLTPAAACAKAAPGVKRSTVLKPDEAFGRWSQGHSGAGRERPRPGPEIVARVWARSPTAADFTSHITKT